VDVEELLGVRVVKLDDGRPQVEYRCRWADGAADSWEPARNLAPDLLRDYEEKWWGYAKKGDREGLLKMMLGGKEVLVASLDKDRRSALHYAAGIGSEAAVELLLENGAEPDLGDKDGYSPLHIAAGYMNKPIVNKLIEWGADPELEDNQGRSVTDLVENLKQNMPKNPMTYVRLQSLNDVETSLLENLYVESLPARVLEVKDLELGRREFLVEWEDPALEPEWVADKHMADDVVEDFYNNLEYAYAARVLDDREVDGAFEYLLEWQDGGEPSWEPAGHVTDTLLKEYLVPLGRWTPPAAAEEEGAGAGEGAAAGGPPSLEDGGLLPM